MLLRRLFRFSTVLLVLLSSATFAQSTEGRSLEDFQTVIKGLNQFQGNFIQQTFDESGDSKLSQSGTFALQQPNKIHWNTIEPWAQLLVTNGELLWFYDPDLEQVTIREVATDTLDQTPALLLFGDAKTIDAIYQMDYTRGENGDRYKFRLRDSLKDAGYSIQQITLTLKWSANKQEVPHSIEFIDMLGQLTVITFSSIKTDVLNDDSLFNWSVPEGVEVFQE